MADADPNPRPPLPLWACILEFYLREIDSSTTVADLIAQHADMNTRCDKPVCLLCSCRDCKFYSTLHYMPKGCPVCGPDSVE